MIRPRLDGVPPRVADFGALHERLLMAGVTTILVIRTQLWLTNYPQLGGHGLHIAHLLWGGMFMLIAIGLLLTFLGRPVRSAAAIVGGVGFGFFIDELGKFITEDNNYFYKPAAALIYLIFIGLFLLARALRRHDELTPRDELANAVDLLGDAARHDLDEDQRGRALALLDRADPRDPLVAPLRAVFASIAARPVAAPGLLERASAAGRRRLARLTGWARFPAFVSWVFAAWAVLSTLGVVELVLAIGFSLGDAHPGYVSDRLGDLRFVNVASLASSFASAGLVALGVVRLRQGRRAEGYRALERALLVAIFVTQVFSFVESQFGAVFGLAIDLVLLWSVRLVARSPGGSPVRTEPASARGRP